MISEQLAPEALQQRREGRQIPEQHQFSLQRTLRIASMVGNELAVHVVENEFEIPEQPGVYLFEGETITDHFDEIAHTDFEFSRATLSGKADSAHAVLPGVLRVHYSGESHEPTVELPVAAKGCYKRPFKDNLSRVRKEVSISHAQEEAGEIAYRPVAVVIAAPPFQGKGTDFTNYDVLLVTRLEQAITTLDNVKWQFGFKKDNIEAATAAISALARFNTTIGHQRDSKIKNFARRPTGETSMIDFETSEVIDLSDPIEVTAMVHGDISMLLDSLVQRGFFAQEPYKAHDVIQNLTEKYLEHWSDFPVDMQDRVFEAATEVSEQCLDGVMRQAHTRTLVKAIAAA